MRYCWDIRKECPFRDSAPSEAKCPAYTAQTPCWEFDWLNFHRAMPDGPEKAEWRKTMLQWCASCEVRREHRGRVDDLIRQLRDA